ncbi:MAG: hypothetical protein HY738_08575, partial [Bacteroidia bacterium]|nr:hypothetical protein [Bacteroidia bacterium]
MKKVKILIAGFLLLCSELIYAQYIGQVQTFDSELIFDSEQSFDIVLIKDGFLTEEEGAPQLPVKILKFIVPFNVKVTDVIITASNVQTLSG